jgi:hypothetical protein
MKRKKEFGESKVLFLCNLVHNLLGQFKKMQTNNEGQEDIQFSWGGKIKWVKN